MPSEILTVDADGHVLEPADTWQRYIDPKFKDRALRVDIDADGFENLFIDNKPTMMLKGRLGALGGIEAKTPGKLAFRFRASAYRTARRRRHDPPRGAGRGASTRCCSTRRSASPGRRSRPESARLAAPTTAGSSTSAARPGLCPLRISLLNPEAPSKRCSARGDICVGVYLSPGRTARRGRRSTTASTPSGPPSRISACRSRSRRRARDAAFAPWAQGTGADGVFRSRSSPSR
jgi:hypothetical protein